YSPSRSRDYTIAEQGPIPVGAPRRHRRLIERTGVRLTLDSTPARMERPRRSKPGPRPTIDRDRIIAAARDIGLEGITMQAIAAHLGVSSAALYRYVKDRDEVVAAAAGTILGELDIDFDGKADDWREFLRECARRIRRALLAHPPVTEHAVLRGHIGESALRLSDRTYEVLTRAGFTDEQAYRSFRLVAAIACTSARDELNVAANPDHVHPQILEMVLALAMTKAEKLQTLRRVVRTDPTMGDHDAQFEFSITCVVVAMDQLLTGGWDVV
ncbi:MAG: TetR/AcrR family transcriptional regulator, partial [Thermoplasmata archaeon]